MRKLLVAILVASASLSLAQDLPKNYNALLKDVEPQLIQWRRHFHEFPELSNREFNTGKYIVDFLKTLPNVEVKYPFAKTGVVAILKGGKPGAVIALRADIDALPVYERSALPFASKVTTEFNGQKVNVMHACGRDVQKFLYAYVHACWRISCKDEILIKVPYIRSPGSSLRNLRELNPLH